MTEKKFVLIFDDIILKQLKEVAQKDQKIKEILSKIFDKIEEKGDLAGKLIDSRLHIYEMKNKSPPIRLYFKPIKDTMFIFLFEFEMKTSPKKQQRTIDRLRKTANDRISKKT